MPSFARELEQTLHNALAEASQRRHEYATLEHLLLALTTDEHASQVMKSCGVDLEDLGGAVGAYLDNELTELTTEGEKIGRKSCRARVGKDGEIPGIAGRLKK